MAVVPHSQRALSPQPIMRAAAADDAYPIARWVTSRDDAYFVAPQTPPPIREDSVRDWVAAADYAFVLAEGQQLLAYGEINQLGQAGSTWWLGHLLVDPRRRRQGLGRLLARSLVEFGRTRLGAKRITLVVFAENVGAIAAYQAAGFRSDGLEWHDLPIYRKRVQMLRMVWG